MTPPRRLSDVEAAFARTHALMHDTTQVTTHVTVRGDLDPAHFRSGAERWAAELPLLSLRIEERPDPLPFAVHRPWDERAAGFVPLAFTREESLALKSWCREGG
ncbi:hypothetical protein ACFXI6_02555 [Streptomyces mirabilis]|uniref:hypothetical protein n=1 Tax=Streptomyces mirabilis TaxID=68239 RepID=UPI0036A77310